MRKPKTIKFGQVWTIREHADLTGKTLVGIITFGRGHDACKEIQSLRICPVHQTDKTDPRFFDNDEIFLTPEKDWKASVKAIVQTWAEFPILEAQLEHYCGLVSPKKAKEIHTALDPIPPATPLSPHIIHYRDFYINNHYPFSSDLFAKLYEIFPD